MIDTYVMDSTALLIYAEDGRGAETVERIMREVERMDQRMLMSLVAWGEVHFICWKALGGFGAEKMEDTAHQLPILFIEPDRSMTLKAAQLMAQYGLNYSDAHTCALAMARQAKLVHGEPQMAALKDEIALIPLQ